VRITRHSALRTRDSAPCGRHSALRTPHSALLGGCHSALRTSRSALGLRHSALRTPHSALLGGYLLIEALAYIAVLFVVLGVAFTALYRCMDHSIALRRNADDISRALHAGERWRADVRAAGTRTWIETTNQEPVLHLEGPRGDAAYRFADDTVFRRLGNGPWTRLLTNVKSSAMEPDRRQSVTAWRWELELKPRVKGVVKPSRIRPLFTFLAVPQTSAMP